MQYIKFNLTIIYAIFFYISTTLKLFILEMKYIFNFNIENLIVIQINYFIVTYPVTVSYVS